MAIFKFMLLGYLLPMANLCKKKELNSIFIAHMPFLPAIQMTSQDS